MFDPTEPNAERMLHWPEPGMSWANVEMIRAFLLAGAAPYVVYLDTEKLKSGEKFSPDRWLIDRLGPKMIHTDYEKRISIWNNGVWLGIADKIVNATGRDFFFIHQHDAFEFKIRWG